MVNTKYDLTPEEPPRAGSTLNAELEESVQAARVITRNHLAVFALACSISGVEWMISNGPDEPVLNAIRHKNDGTQSQLPEDIYMTLPGAVMTESGFNLRTKLEFARWYPDTPRVLPSMFDVILLGEDSEDTLISSKISIDKPWAVDPSVSIIVGLTAIHSVQYHHHKPRFETLNGEVGPGAFRPLFTALEDTSAGTFDRSELVQDIVTASRVTAESGVAYPQYTTPENLGVPASIADRARNNFSTLEAHISLLVGDDPDR